MSIDMPTDNAAVWTLLHAGYTTGGVAGTVVLVVEGDMVAVVDPGMVANRSCILDPLAAAGFAAADVTDVVLSHHHPDHTLNAALFPLARVHDFQAVYRNDEWADRPADGVSLSPSTRLLHVPGHTPQDIATVIATADGVAVCTHAWWNDEGPAEDPYAPDADQLHRARERVLALAEVIIPGHGEPFVPTDKTVR
jgi:glyoxylase-like metal-dependent hydrolase (beta-lactamase superfamily II)